ncbi:hypothetical protein [Ralstonia solanacearum]|uniref:hypothetical protein n=1 Tax=Ralstonia solanacearum TaxID=305 RepID=UPI0005ACD0F8|nr:hypothetical protein [Ralstonia solanacearum]
MPEFEMKGEGDKQISVDEEGKTTIRTDQPAAITPSLPVTDIRVNVVELVSASVEIKDGCRIFRGQYADGGRVEFTLNFESGTFQTSGHEVISQLADGDDRSHTVLTYLPKQRSITKKTH